MPVTNKEFWSKKFCRTLERDQKSQQELEKSGWATAVIWECRLEKGISSLIERLVQIEQPGGAKIEPSGAAETEFV